MARASNWTFGLLLLSLAVQSFGLRVGVNYGRVADNIPPPAQVAAFLRSIGVQRIKIYDADPAVLAAFANTGVYIVIGLGDQTLQSMTDQATAQNWVQQKVQPHLPQTQITSIIVGNEVFAADDTVSWSNILPAMRNVHSALVNLNLDKQVTVTTAHALNVLATSDPPSTGAFRQDIVQYMQPILEFQSQVNSPFMINAYPFFAYKENSNQIPLPYVLFEPNQGHVDQNTNLVYDNMLYAQIDAVYAAIKALGHEDIEVRVAETGWPSKGDADEPGASPDYARRYNGNLIHRIERGQATPAKPKVPVQAYVFALFNEDLKPGPTSERNYGLYYPDTTPVYDLNLYKGSPQLTYSSCPKINGFHRSSLLVVVLVYFLSTYLS